MAVVLRVDRASWWRHVADTFTAYDGAITAVVKGNGYGFGRSLLTESAAAVGARSIAVGTVYELPGTEAFDGDVLALTPSLDALSGLAPNVVSTVGSTAQLDHLRRSGHDGRLGIKLRSSMQRYGFAPGEVPEVAALRPMSAHVYMIHLPLSGTMNDHCDEIEAWLPQLDPSIEISVSHLDPPAFADLRRRHPERSFSIRLGTALWLGDRSSFRLFADVLDRRTVHQGDRVGYRATAIAEDGTIVLVGAGSANGVAPVDNGLSPFHFARTRLGLIEPPHMHTSMIFIPATSVVPDVGAWVDLQRPMTMTHVDRIEWID